MHWFTDYALDNFLLGMADEFQVVELEGSSLDVSIDRLPSRPTIMVLRPSYINVAQ